MPDEVSELEQLRREVAAQHFGDADYADMLTNTTLEGLRRQAERLRERGLGPSPSRGSPAPEVEVWRWRQRAAAARERVFGSEEGA